MLTGKLPSYEELLFSIELLTIPQVTEWARVSAKTIYRWIDTGNFPVLNRVLLKATGNRLMLAAAGGFRLAVAEMSLAQEAVEDGFQVVVPARALGKRLLSPVEEQPHIHSLNDAANILLPVLSHREQEYLVVIVLNSRQHVLDVVEVYHSSLNSAQIRAAEVFKPTIQRNAAGIIIGHNHPSGDPTPFPDDVTITRALVEAGKLLDIELVDHLICGAGGRFTSLKERGLGFS